MHHDANGLLNTFGSSDAQPFWAALTADANVCITLLSDDGVFLYANDVTVRLFGGPDGQIVGRRMSDVMPIEVATERLEYVRGVMSSGKPVAVEGMMQGVLRRAVFRPLPPDDHGRRNVLCVCRMVTDIDKATTQDGIPVVRAKHDDLGVLGALTTREMEILRLIGKGLSTADIAKQLHRSVKTIEWHRVSLGTKLGVTNRVELARIAIRAGVVGLALEAAEAPAEEA
jgi:DNA-binding CsgD family transcriptional regulator